MFSLSLPVFTSVGFLASLEMTGSFKGRGGGRGVASPPLFLLYHTMRAVIPNGVRNLIQSKRQGFLTKPCSVTNSFH